MLMSVLGGILEILFAKNAQVNVRAVSRLIIVNPVLLDIHYIKVFFFRLIKIGSCINNCPFEFYQDSHICIACPSNCKMCQGVSLS